MVDRMSASAEAPRGRPFNKGESGNPAGRPMGARNRTTLAAEALLDGEAEALTRKVIDLAKNGDLKALRLCLDRVLPPRRERYVSFELPPLKSAEDSVQAMVAIADAVASGEITPGEAAELGKFVESCVKVLEAADFDRRLQLLEMERSLFLEMKQNAQINGAALGRDGSLSVRDSEGCSDDRVS